MYSTRNKSKRLVSAIAAEGIQLIKEKNRLNNKENLKKKFLIYKSDGLLPNLLPSNVLKKFFFVTKLKNIKIYNLSNHPGRRKIKKSKKRKI